MMRQHALNKVASTRPESRARFEDLIQFGNAERWKCAWEAGCRTRRKRQLGRCGKSFTISAMVSEGKDQPMLGFHHLRRRMQLQALGVPGEIGHRHE